MNAKPILRNRNRFVSIAPGGPAIKKNRAGTDVDFERLKRRLLAIQIASAHTGIRCYIASKQGVLLLIGFKFSSTELNSFSTRWIHRRFPTRIWTRTQKNLLSVGLRNSRQTIRSH